MDPVTKPQSPYERTVSHLVGRGARCLWSGDYARRKGGARLRLEAWALDGRVILVQDLGRDGVDALAAVSASNDLQTYLAGIDRALGLLPPEEPAPRA